MKSLLAHSVAAIALLSSSFAYAEDPTWFEVEILVFSQDSTTSEQWPDNQKPFKTNGAIDLFQSIRTPDLSALELALNGCDSQQWQLDPLGCELREQELKQPAAPDSLAALVAAEHLGNPATQAPYLLTEDMLQFVDQATQLRRSGSKILLHSGWQMPVYGKRSAKSFRIYGGKNYQEQYQNNGSVVVEEAEPLSNFSWLAPLESNNDMPIWQLDGTVKIYLNQFLFIQTQLGLRKPSERPLAPVEPEPVVQNLGETNQGVQIFAIDDQPLATDAIEMEPYLATIGMNQARRVRSREIHYFDHPEMGMVMQIRRMEQPQLAELPQQDTGTATTTTLR
ncbi:CsiV family protein [Ferrimonas lipolytica]|uniref:Peptidoglycan-binding protein, CsiV n=1 Tax=Ferrimonas lipolytica TaxID=2724191 RepID=A0A6H1UAW6_9GAMM|nr:CsiV family protein [Ferrimonas lipolytica]QIZ75978.1 hypothetical protein HER31_03220 [Ferrimonas lipolytica]